MAKNDLYDWSTAAANNTDVGSISIAEGMNPSNVNNALREMMKQHAEWLNAGAFQWADGAGTADAITATYAVAIPELVDGLTLGLRATAANATTTPTFAPDGLTAHTIVKDGGDALVAGDIAGDGHELFLRYDLSNTRWELLNPKIDQRGVAVSVSSSAATTTLDLAGNNRSFYTTLTENTTVAFSNVPASPTVVYVLLEVAHGASAYTLSFPSAVKAPGGLFPSLTDTNGKTDLIGLTTRDGGTTWRYVEIGYNYDG